MKRAATKTVKAYPACAADNDTQKGHLKPAQPEVKRLRYSAAMIGLAISIEASSLLLTRQSARSALVVEPVGNNQTVSTVPITTATTPNLPTPVQKVGKPITVNGDANAILKVKHKVAPKHLKPKSNSLKGILAEFKFEKSKSASATMSLPPSAAVEKALTTNQAKLVSLIAGTSGGRIPAKTTQPIPTVAGIHPAQTTAAKTELQFNPYVQNLQTEIKRLRQKYPTQQTVSRVMPVVTKASTAIPINQLRLAQAAQLLQPAMQKQSLIQVSSPIPVRATLPMITAPMEVESSGSYQSPNRRQVAPDLPVATVNTYLPKPLAVFKGYMWPAKGVVTSPYGWRWGRMHKGIDIAAPIGTPVFAAAPGVVVTAGWSSGGYGNLVDVQHADGSLTRYAHNSRVLVQVGQMVAQGQEISEMGSSGFSTGPHCHFEVHPRGHGAVNPIAYLPR